MPLEIFDEGGSESKQDVKEPQQKEAITDDKTRESQDERKEEHNPDKKPTSSTAKSIKLKAKMKKEPYRTLGTVILGIGIAYFIRTFILALCIVEGTSMAPTLGNGDIVVINKVTQPEDYKRGNIVVFDNGDNNYFVKRVIGFPGDKISINDNKLYINNKIVKETYIDKKAQEVDDLNSMDDMEQVTVPKNEYFVMGDNRLFSFDSRNGLGLIKTERMVGKSLLVIDLPF